MSTYKKRVEFPNQEKSGIKNGDYWVLCNGGDSANVSVARGTTLIINSIVIEIKQSCRIYFPLNAMTYTEVMFSEKPASISFSNSNSSYRSTSGVVDIPGEKTIQFRNGIPMKN